MSITSTLQHMSPSEMERPRGYFSSAHPSNSPTPLRRSLDSSHERENMNNLILQTNNATFNTSTQTKSSSAPHPSPADSLSRMSHGEQERRHHHQQHQHRGSGPEHSMADADMNGTSYAIGEGHVSRAPSLRAVAGISNGVAPGTVTYMPVRSPPIPSRRPSIKTESPVAGQSPINHVRQLSLVQFEKSIEYDESLSKSLSDLTRAKRQGGAW
ncbi:hypothetical protein BDF19DRAFT_150298 [Syncephalis fuscata]|nr:hypothetical protein BDF19DRAFT_150298 [Syncephalis fuscata]